MGNVKHYNGEQWSDVEVNTTANLLSVWGVDRDQAYAVGDHGTIVAWDGEDWTSVQDGREYRLRCVHGNARGNVFACGEQGTWLSRQSDGTWQALPTNTTWTLNSTWVAADGSVAYAVGNNGIALRWQDGGVTPIDLTEFARVREHATSWRSNYSLFSRGLDEYVAATCSAIWGSSPTDLYVGMEKRILHYDGVRWIVCDFDSEARDFIREQASNITSLHGRAANDIHAVGTNGLILHYDGDRWSRIDARAYDNICSVFCGSGTGAYLVFGGEFHTRVEYRGGPDRTAIYLLDRAVLHDVVSEVGPEFSDIVAMPGGVAVATTYQGRVFVLDGSRWSERTSAGRNHPWGLVAIAGSREDDLLAAATGGVYRWDGLSWAQDFALPKVKLLDIARCDTGLVVAIGETYDTRRGVIVQRCNGKWGVGENELMTKLIGVSVFADTCAYVIADGGIVWEFDGREWAAEVHEEWAGRSAIWATGCGNFWLAGGRGLQMYSRPVLSSIGIPKLVKDTGGRLASGGGGSTKYQIALLGDATVVLSDTSDNGVYVLDEYAWRYFAFAEDVPHAPYSKYAMSASGELGVLVARMDGGIMQLGPENMGPGRR